MAFAPGEVSDSLPLVCPGAASVRRSQYHCKVTNLPAHRPELFNIRRCLTILSSIFWTSLYRVWRQTNSVIPAFAVDGFLVDSDQRFVRSCRVFRQIGLLGCSTHRYAEVSVQDQVPHLGRKFLNKAIFMNEKAKGTQVRWSRIPNSSEIRVARRVNSGYATAL